MNVFDEVIRSEVRPMAANERQFTYLNTSARPEAARVRAKIDEWFGRYPIGSAESLRARIRSVLDKQHNSAIFELIIHEMLLKTGHIVESVEPKLEHTSKSPDFMVRSQDGARFFIEAVVDAGVSDRESANSARLNDVINCIDQIHSPYHYLGVQFQGELDRPLRQRELKSAITDWLSCAGSTLSALNQIEPLEFEANGLTVTINAFPRPKPAPGARAIGAILPEAKWTSVGGGIKNTLKSKASRYGDLGLPYLVAINSCGLGVSDDNLTAALFGSIAYKISPTHDGKFTGEPYREDDCLWLKSGKPQNKRMSAVLFFEGVSAWNIATQRALLVKNPWARYPMLECRIGADERIVVHGEFQDIRGKSFGEIMNIDSCWPRDP